MSGAEISEQIVKTDAYEYNVATAGDGAPLVLLHAMGGSWRWWLPQIEALKSRYRIYAVDLPGAGKASAISSLPDHDRFLGSVDQLFDKLDITSGDIVGQSLGGYVALSYIIGGYGRFKRAVAVAPGGVIPLKFKKYITLGVSALSVLPLPTALYARVIGLSYRGLLDVNGHISDALNRSYSRKSIRRSLAFQMRHSHVIPLLAELIQMNDFQPSKSKTKVKLFWGERDSIFPYRHAPYLSNLLGGVELVSFARSRHWPQLDEAEKFRQELVKFCD